MPYADPSSPAAIASRNRTAKRHYDSHREQAIARATRWTKKNMERVKELSVIRRSQKLPPEKVLWSNARNRAKAKNIEFTLRVDDITMPAVCPVLGIPLVIGTGYAKDGSPSLDRVNPAKGYTPDNVRVISHKANTIKSNASIQDLRLVLAYMERENG